MKPPKSAATEARSFRTFLLMQQFAAREIGERIAQARRENGAMTQEELADALNVSTRALQDYEAGKRIPWKHFSRLEQIFKRDLEWFLHGETELSPDEGEILKRLNTLAEAVAAVGRDVTALDRKLDVLLIDEGRLRELEQQLDRVAQQLENV